MRQRYALAARPSATPLTVLAVGTGPAGVASTCVPSCSARAVAVLARGRVAVIRGCQQNKQ
jgi:hypothetical protein